MLPFALSIIVVTLPELERESLACCWELLEVLPEMKSVELGGRSWLTERERESCICSFRERGNLQTERERELLKPGLGKKIGGCCCVSSSSSL